MTRREDAAEREDAGEAIAVHGARDQEPERRSVLAEERDDVVHEHDVAAEERRLLRGRRGQVLRGR